MNTRRYPRSMAEAFGPYTDNALHPMREQKPSPWLRAFGWLCTFGLLAAIGVLLAWRG